MRMPDPAEGGCHEQARSMTGSSARARRPRVIHARAARRVDHREDRRRDGVGVVAVGDERLMRRVRDATA